VSYFNRHYAIPFSVSPRPSRAEWRNDRMPAEAQKPTVRLHAQQKQAAYIPPDGFFSIEPAGDPRAGLRYDLAEGDRS
jgi:hypothetical protein